MDLNGLKFDITVQHNLLGMLAVASMQEARKGTQETQGARSKQNTKTKNFLRVLLVSHKNGLI